jgi:hypothetical protein
LPVRVPVTVAARPSADHPPLDDFQRHGAAAAVNGIVGGRSMPPGRTANGSPWPVAACPDGVEVRIVIDTPDRSASVGDLVCDVVAQIAAATPVLSGVGGGRRHR